MKKFFFSKCAKNLFKVIFFAAAYNFFCVFFAYCQSENFFCNTNYNFSNVRLEWKAVKNAQGIFFAEYRQKKFLIHCAKIDLHSPTLKIEMLPKKNHSKSVFVKNFARSKNLAIAFNTTPFAAKGLFKNKGQTPRGLCVNCGQELSKPLGTYCALAFFCADGVISAKIFDSQNSPLLKNALFAAGGFWQILKQGKIIPFEEIYDSRTFCALDNEGKTLYVFAAEGKNSSAGLTYMQCAAFAKSLGLQNAMQFDGGSSSELVIEGKSVLKKKPKVKVPAAIGFK